MYIRKGILSNSLYSTNKDRNFTWLGIIEGNYSNSDIEQIQSLYSDKSCIPIIISDTNLMSLYYEFYYDCLTKLFNNLSVNMYEE